ncbi:MAG: TonB-dependent receptor [Alphaproteobacteria bacterium]|nr:TonB-dependent receptor [Alphaproteobacteria bacterium]MDE1985686.1 TonB-dependent receptor [Alphaproteobacteria bacterium]MDE2161879.1 TonB-dependent receptor [Alphaproteobacteria bacterium]MDE2264950.1 TonB-dependent receptor [Alphaproteobacteria bacterium]
MGQRSRLRLHKVLLGSVSALAVGALIGPALAQDNAAQPVETVVVTGIRASLQSAQSIKENSSQVVDSITAVDIGALPDRNVADALQRVPGVTLQRTDQNRDPVRYGGTGNGVYIRGLAWVNSLVNGRDEFSASNGRSLSFADVSADLLSGVNVYKNPDAKMIEGGVGGTVDLLTRKPFDQDSRLIAASADYTYGDLIGKGHFSGNALYSDRWDTKIGEMGALLSVDYQDQQNRTNSYSLSHFDCVDASTPGSSPSLYGSTACNAITTSNRRYIPNYLDWRQIDWEQKRLAFDGSFQWRPNDEWLFTAEAFYSKADPTDIEHSLPYNVPQDPTSSAVNYTYDPNGTWTGGTITNGQTGGIDTRVGRHHDFNGDYTFNAKFNPSEAWAFSADVQYTESRATNYSMTAYTDMGNPNDAGTPGVPGENVKIDLTGSTPVLSVSDPAAMAVGTNYYYSAAMDHMENNFAHSWAYRADGSYTFHDQDGWLKSVDFGFRGEMKQAVTRQTGYNWSLLSHQSWGGGPPVFMGQTGYTGGTQNPALPGTVSLFNYGSFFGSQGPQAWFVNPNFLLSGTSNIYSILKDTESAGWGWTPYATQQNCPKGVDVKCNAIYGGFTPEADNVSAGINDQKEDTFGGYLMVNYGHDDFLGTGVPVDGNIGVRIVQTQDQTTQGKLVLPSISSGCSSPPASSCADYNTAIAFSNGGGSVTIPAVSNTYTDVLPSFNFRAHLSDTLQARFAFSQGIVRPDFSYTQNFDSLGFGFGQSGTALEGTFNSVTTGRTGTGGNPYLKPMHANNYDASLEWYFAPTGSLTFAMFHKDLTNYFLTGPVPVTFTNNGVTETFQVTETVNGSKGKVEGFELAYQQFYDSLPGFLGGFGLQANYTKIYNSGGANPTVNLFETVEIGNAQAPLPLEGMSPDSYNLALLYEKYGISGRLAYNWRSRFLLTSSAANVNQPIWSENYGQLDGSIFYTFMSHYKIGIQATNLLKSSTILDVGYTNYHPRYDWIETDRKISLVLRANW